MSIQTSPNGITTSDAAGLTTTDLGAALGVGTTTFVRNTPLANQALMADIILASVTGGVARTLLMPPMPVGSEVTFILDFNANTDTFVIQETGGDGNADAIATQSSIATNVAFVKAALLDGATVTDSITLAGGTVALLVAASALVLLTIKKIRESSAATVSDGWIVTAFSGQEYT